MTLAPRRRPRAERGFALFIVISMLGILAVVAISLASAARLRAVTLRNNSDLLAARGLAEAALSLAKLDLSRGSAHQLFPPDGARHSFRIEGGEASFAVEDESGKLDLRRQPPQHLASLIARVGRGAAISAEALAARIRGAAPNSVMDLARVPGVTPQLYAALAPHVTVYSDSARVNIDDASPEAMLSLPGITPALVQQVLQARAAGTPRPSLGAGEAYATTMRGPVFTIVATGRTTSGIEARIVEVVAAASSDLTSRVQLRTIERR